jgi:hypothetical protein
MNIDSTSEPAWPSGDCRAVIATKLSLEELTNRIKLSIFRAKDDLDWFSGAIINHSKLGYILIMRHDNNPLKLSVFYVDVGQDYNIAQLIISALFLKKNEIDWVLKPESK